MANEDPWARSALSRRARLKNRVGDWKEIREDVEVVLDRIRDAEQANEDARRNDPNGVVISPATIQRWKEELFDLRQRRARIVDDIEEIVRNRPSLKDDAVSMGFREDLLPDVEPSGGTPDGAEGSRSSQPSPPQGPPSGNSDQDERGGGGAGSGIGGGGGGGGNPPNLGHQARGNRLLGDEAERGQYTVVRGPRGTYVAVYTYRINGEVTKVGLTLGNDPDKLSRYGIKPTDAKSLTKAQMKRIKKIGSADELSPYMRKGDKAVFTALVRSLETQYPASVAGAILRDDEVMSKIIARSMFGWTNTEFEAQVKDTKWWRTTEPHQRIWLTSFSPKQKRNSINSAMETVINSLEDTYGREWMRHVDGGVEQAREWATKIASGVWGTPDVGFEFWKDRQFDRAARIENTPAWIMQQQEQEEIRSYANRPEEKAEELRSRAMHYLGQVNGKALVDDQTLKRFAVDIVTQAKSDADFDQFLRKQMKALHPYFDENQAFTDQASPYKSLLEATMGTPAKWDNPLLRQFSQVDPNGQPTEKAMSLHDFELLVRDPDRNPEAYQAGTPLYDEGMERLGGILARMRGVS